MGDEIQKFVDVPGGFLYYPRSRVQGWDVFLLNAGAADLRMWDIKVPWLADPAGGDLYSRCRS